MEPAGDWRAHLQADIRLKNKNKIMEILKRSCPHEEVQQLMKRAEMAEENFYTGATSESQYSKSMRLTILTLEANSPNPFSNSVACMEDPGSQPIMADVAYLQHMSRVQQRHLIGQRDFVTEQLQLQQQMLKATEDLSLLDLMPSSDAVGDTTGDWRANLQADIRLKNKNKITEILKRSCPHEEVRQLMKRAEMAEENFYTGATSESQYSKSIRLTILTLEANSPNSFSNSVVCMEDPGSQPTMADVAYLQHMSRVQQRHLVGQRDFVTEQLQQQMIKATEDLSLLDLMPTSGALGDTVGDWRGQLQADFLENNKNNMFKRPLHALENITNKTCSF